MSRSAQELDFSLRAEFLALPEEGRGFWILDPMRETLSVYRWTDVAYLEVLTAERGEQVRAEPCDAVESDVGMLFGDDGGGACAGFAPTPRKY